MISKIRIPDSSSVSQCYCDTEFIPCSGLAGSGIECSGSGRAVVHQRGVWEGVLWGFVVTLSLDHQLHILCLRPLWQNFASSGDIGCGEAAWPDILIMAAPCEHYLLKLKLTVVACIVLASHPIEQNYLIQWAIGGIFPPQVFPTRLRHP